jgi:hypothetical protein
VRSLSLTLTCTRTCTFHPLTIIVARFEAPLRSHFRFVESMPYCNSRPMTSAVSSTLLGVLFGLVPITISSPSSSRRTVLTGVNSTLDIVTFFVKVRRYAPHANCPHRCEQNFRWHDNSIYVLRDVEWIMMTSPQNWAQIHASRRQHSFFNTSFRCFPRINETKPNHRHQLNNRSLTYWQRLLISQPTHVSVTSGSFRMPFVNQETDR